MNIIKYFVIACFILWGPLASAANTVPFVSQAPYGEWRDARFQDACEETSVLMAAAWARNEKLDKKRARTEILKMAEYQKKKYGSFRDTSTLDTYERLVKNYSGLKKSRYLASTTLDGLKAELLAGNIIIMPVDGRKLKNPYFTQPGPERHMILIIAYDKAKKAFITNDPGTRRGASYRYPEEIVWSALRDYPSGNHQPIKGQIKNAIIISKEK